MVVLVEVEGIHVEMHPKGLNVPDVKLSVMSAFLDTTKFTSIAKTTFSVNNKATLPNKKDNKAYWSIQKQLLTKFVLDGS